MRTNEERITALHNKAVEIERERRNHIVKLCYIGAAVFSVAAVILISVIIPTLSSNIGLVSANMGMSGSIFSDSNMLNLIIIALAAFLLGISVTVFCYRMSHWQKMGMADDKQEKNELKA